MPLTTGQVAQFRTVANRFLTDTCSIQTYTAVSDSEGGQTDTWNTTQTGVPCRVSATGLTPDERALAGRVTTERLYAATLPQGTTITNRDRIVWSGNTLEVISVAVETDQIVLRVLAVQVV